MVEVGERVARQRSPDIRKINPVIMERTDTFCARCLFLSSPVVLLPWLQGAKRPSCAPEEGFVWGMEAAQLQFLELGSTGPGCKGRLQGQQLGMGTGMVGKASSLSLDTSLLCAAWFLQSSGCLCFTSLKQSDSQPLLRSWHRDLHAFSILHECLCAKTQGWGWNQVMDPISCASSSSTA